VFIVSYVPATTQLSIPIRWVDLQAQLFRDSTFTGSFNLIFPRLSPRMRIEAIFDHCAYNAWVPYNSAAKFSVPTIPATTPKITGNANNLATWKEQTINYAVYRCMKHEFRFMHETLQAKIDTFFTVELGLNPTITTSSYTDSSYTRGNWIAEKVLNYTNGIDRTNSNGQDPRGTIGEIYSDPTQYVPVNDPQPAVGITDCSTLKSINHWQPARLSTDGGVTSFVQTWPDTQFVNLKPWASESGASHRVLPPYWYGTGTEGAFNDTHNEILQVFGNLDDQKKAHAEFWLLTWWRHDIALAIAKQRDLSLDNAIKYFFVVGQAMSDMNIAQFDGKRMYNFARPTQVIQCINQGKTVQSWKGPYQGVGSINAGEWRAYRPLAFIQNSGPEYPCGHCTGTGAFVEVSRRFFGSETANYNRTFLAGTYVLEPKVTNPEDPRFVDGLTNVANTGANSVGYAPATDITLNFANWGDFDTSVIEGRINLGVHTRMAGIAGVQLGHTIGSLVYEKALAMFNGN